MGLTHTGAKIQEVSTVLWSGQSLVPIFTLALSGARTTARLKLLLAGRPPCYNPHMGLEFSVDQELSSYGHHFIVGISGPTLSDADKRFLSMLKPGGILLLGRNFDHTSPYEVWIEKLRELIRGVKQYTERSELLITLDHEGRRVTRTPAPITVFPNARKFAPRAAEVARIHARELRTLGVNLSWAPVADVDSNPNNPIIGERAFGDTPDKVARFAREYLEALEAEGILGCAKHFPGHGDTSTDSHLELPVVDITEYELLSRELPPFQALVEAGVSFVMTAHILYPQIDPDRPATMSSRILDGILRKQLGFDRVVVSDDLDMSAVSDRFAGSGTAITEAFNAGCDMFIVARNKVVQDQSAPDRAILSAQFIADAVQSGALSEARLQKAFERINQVFEQRLETSLEPKVMAAATLSEHQRIATSLA